MERNWKEQLQEGDHMYKAQGLRAASSSEPVALSKLLSISREGTDIIGMVEQKGTMDQMSTVAIYC